MKLSVAVVSGPDAGQTFDLPVGNTRVFGRSQQCDTMLNDPSISRVHFEIANHGDSVVLADRGSSSGTFVNGNNVKTSELAVGAVIKIGDTTLKLTSGSDKTIAPTAGEQDTNTAQPLNQLLGSTLGPYKLNEIIGVGASGMVFKAHDAEKDRVAAVKVLTPQFTSNDEQRQRFVRAMKTMLPIRDEHIVRLFNAGKTGPYCWAAMEFIDGESLADRIEKIGIDGMLDWRKVWRVALDVGLALKAGHENKIVHRNVTPKNILMRSSDGACLLGDFMLAKALEGTLAQQVTQPGQILGEVAYLAPERTRGDGEVDTRSDMYGLGATCYALLTGRPPISGNSITDLIKNVRDEIPAPPKKFQLSINDIFQDIVLKLIAKDPAERFAKPDDLVKELLRVGKFNNLDAGF